MEKNNNLLNSLGLTKSFERSLIMPDRIYDIICQFSQQLKDIMGSQLIKVIVYGSYARGDFNSKSDVDVMILVKMSDSEIKKIENQVYDLAFDIEMDTGIDIYPIIKNENQYEYWLDTLTFYKNIHEQGMVVNDEKLLNLSERIIEKNRVAYVELSK